MELTGKNKIDELKERLENQITDCKITGDDLNLCSWAYQEGVIITANEAQIFLDLLEKQTQLETNN